MTKCDVYLSTKTEADSGLGDVHTSNISGEIIARIELKRGNSSTSTFAGPKRVRSKQIVHVLTLETTSGKLTSL